MNTKVNKERPGSTFKIPSTTKSPITTKPSNSQQTTKLLKRTYSIESMDSDTDRVVASLNLEEIIKKLQYLKPLNCRQTYKLSHFFELLIS